VPAKDSVCAGGAAGVAIGTAAVAAYARAHRETASSRPRPGPAAWPRPSSSAPWPGCCPPSAPRAYHQPRHSWPS